MKNPINKKYIYLAVMLILTLVGAGLLELGSNIMNEAYTLQNTCLVYIEPYGCTRTAWHGDMGIFNYGIEIGLLGLVCLISALIMLFKRKKDEKCEGSEGSYAWDKECVNGEE